MQDSTQYNENNHKPIEQTLSGDVPAEDSSVEDIIRLLDGYTQSGGSRMKLQVVEGEGRFSPKHIITDAAMWEVHGPRDSRLMFWSAGIKIFHRRFVIVHLTGGAS